MKKHEVRNHKKSNKINNKLAGKSSTAFQLRGVMMKKIIFVSVCLAVFCYSNTAFGGARDEWWRPTDSNQRQIPQAARPPLPQENLRPALAGLNRLQHVQAEPRLGLAGAVQTREIRLHVLTHDVMILLCLCYVLYRALTSRFSIYSTFLLHKGSEKISKSLRKHTIKPDQL